MLRFRSSACFFILSCVGLAIVLMLFVSACSSDKVKVPPPPETAVVDVTDNVNGVMITDAYRWLENQESPDTRAWIKAQNDYTDGILNKLPGRAELKEFLSRMIKVDSQGMPAAVAGRYFFFQAAGGPGPGRPLHAAGPPGSGPGPDRPAQHEPG